MLDVAFVEQAFETRLEGAAYGDNLMTRLRAIRRDRATEGQDGDVAEDE